MKDVKLSRLESELATATRCLRAARQGKSDDCVEDILGEISDLKQEIEDHKQKSLSEGAVLSELWQMTTEAKDKKKKKPSSSAASAVYHRDYVKTKNKPYRKYDPSEYSKSKD